MRDIIGVPMEFSMLKIFQTEASEGSVSRAAQKLNYVQPNVTARIRQLEEELGTSLFYRKPRGMVISPSGATLLRYCERIFKIVNEAKDALAENGLASGTFLIGSTTAFASYNLARAITRYHEKYPDVQILLRTMVSEKLVEGVLHHELVGAFVNGSVNNDQIISETVCRDELVFAISREYPSLEALHHKTALVFGRGCTFRAYLEFWLRKQGLLPYEVSEMGSLEGIMDCVAGGIGFTMLPKSIVARYSYDDRIITLPIDAELSALPTVFIRRKDIAQLAVLQALLEEVKVTSCTSPN